MSSGTDPNAPPARLRNHVRLLSGCQALVEEGVRAYACLSERTLVQGGLQLEWLMGGLVCEKSG